MKTISLQFYTLLLCLLMMSGYTTAQSTQHHSNSDPISVDTLIFRHDHKNDVRYLTVGEKTVIKLTEGQKFKGRFVRHSDNLIVINQDGSEIAIEISEIDAIKVKNNQKTASTGKVLQIIGGGIIILGGVGIAVAFLTLEAIEAAAVSLIVSPLLFGGGFQLGLLGKFMQHEFIKFSGGWSIVIE